MPANQIHLVRHGEVHNPTGVLYGRIPEFHLSELGHTMAAAAARSLAGHDVTRLGASPLLRAQESAQPWADAFALNIHTDDRLIEPTNLFEGMHVRTALRNPRYWPWMINPVRPSWGEPFTGIAARMLAAVHDAWQATDAGDAVLVSHQLPIWMVHRAVATESLFHDPRKRRCSLSSITTFERHGDRFVEVNYQDPAADLLAASTDLGAV